MKAEAMNLLQWQERFGTEEGCIEALKQQRWSSGFQCPKCGHDHGHWIANRKVYQCVSPPGLRDGWYALSLQQCSLGAVVPDDLSDGLRQRWFVGPAIVQANRGILDYRAPDAAQDASCHGRSGQHLSSGRPCGAGRRFCRRTAIRREEWPRCGRENTDSGSRRKP